MQKVIIWGANGFLRRNLVNSLKEKNYIYAIVNENSKVPKEWIKYENLKVVTQEAVEIIDKADIMYFFAWHGTSGELRGDMETQLENVKLTCEAVRIAAYLQCQKFVYAGSIMEYEAIEYLNRDGTVPNRNYIYSASKLLADYYAKILSNDLKIEYCNALISNIYGPGEISKRFIVTMCSKLLRNERMELTSGMQLYDFIYIDDAIKALELIGKKGRNNYTYYIGNKTQKPLKEYILSMKKVVNSSAELVFGAVDFTGVSLSYQEFNTSTLYDDLGFQCAIDFEEGIHRTAEWIREVDKNGNCISY